MLPKKKRIMRSFRLDEVSAVDLPAQVGAKALIFKRHDEVNDTMSNNINIGPSAAVDAILESISSILEDNELSDNERVEHIAASVQQYVQYIVATGATLDDPDFGGPDELGAKITAVTKAAAVEGEAVASSAAIEYVARAYAESQALPGESIAKARARFWESDDGRLFMEAAKRAPKGETAQQRRERLKQERAARDGAPSRSKVVGKLHEHAAAKHPQMSLAKAVEKIATSGDETDREIWNAAKNAA